MKLILLLAGVAASACQPRAADPPIAPQASAATAVPMARPLHASWTRLRYPATRECGIVGSGDWSGRLITAPGERPRLAISGWVSTKPTTRLTLRLDPRVLESFPVQRMVWVEAAMDAYPTPDIAEGRTLQGEWPIDGSPGVVTVRCGRTILATIRDTEAAL